MTPPHLHLRHVAVRARNQAILDIEQFNVAAGESIALVGPNGAGKTTLLHVAALLLPPDSGEVIIDGERATTANARALRRSISMVFQDSLLFNVSVLDNAAAGLRFQGMARPEAAAVAREWLGRFDVAHLERRQARGLSGGEASRVALARAFATSPSLLLLDEPFSSLDAPTRATLVPELREHIRSTSAAAVLVSHDLEEALGFTDSLAVMEHGRLLARGNAAALMATPPSRRVAELLAIDNILPATVVATLPPQRLILALASGLRLTVCAPHSQDFQVSEAVVIAFSASSAIALPANSSASEGWNVLPGTISASTPQRHGLMLSVAVPEIVNVFVSWPERDRAWALANQVDIALSPGAATILPA